jgi:hypothetical protein
MRWLASHRSDRGLGAGYRRCLVEWLNGSGGVNPKRRSTSANDTGYVTPWAQRCCWCLLVKARRSKSVPNPGRVGLPDRAIQWVVDQPQWRREIGASARGLAVIHAQNQELEGLFVASGLPQTKDQAVWPRVGADPDSRLLGASIQGQEQDGEGKDAPGRYESHRRRLANDLRLSCKARLVSSP